MRESCARLAAEGHADRLQDGDQPLGLAGIDGDELGHPLREKAAWAARISAHEFPHRELEANRTRAPREVRQVALVAAVHRGRGHSAGSLSPPLWSSAGDTPWLIPSSPRSGAPHGMGGVNA